MSDFFEGLAARSSGAATALRPRVASAYEAHDGIVEIVEEVPAATHGGGQAIVPVLADSGQAGLPVLHNPEPAPARQVVVRDVVLTRTETRESPPVHDERIVERVVQVPGGEQAIPPVQPGTIAWPPPTEVETREHTHHHHHLLREASSAAEAAAAPQERVVVEERIHEIPGKEPGQVIRQLAPVDRPASARRDAAAAAFARPPVIDRQTPAAEPAVRITIGRVEVRAVQPAQPAPRPAPAPPPPGPTLEEFLEQRERRK